MPDEPLDRERILARAYADSPKIAPRPKGRRSRLGWGAFLAVAVIGIGGWFLANKLLEVSRIQDCVMQGRKNCNPIDDPGGH